MKEALRSLIVREAAVCVGREGSKLSQARADLKRRYLGHGYSSDAERGERGLSTYVDRTVLETVEWAKPGLMRLFGGGEEIIRFDPRSPEQEEAAEAATVYVNQAAFGRNMFKIVHDVLADGLFQRVGWCLAHVVRRDERRMRRFVGLTEAEALALAAEVAMSGGQTAGAPAAQAVTLNAGQSGGPNAGQISGTQEVQPGAVLAGAQGAAQHFALAGGTVPDASSGGVKAVTGRGSGIHPSLFPSSAAGTSVGQTVSGGAASARGGAFTMSGAQGKGVLAGEASSSPSVPSASSSSSSSSSSSLLHAGQNGPMGARGTERGSVEALDSGDGEQGTGGLPLAGASGAVPGKLVCGPLSLRFTRRETPEGTRFDAVLHRTVERRELRLDPVPSEQVILSADAQDVERARFVAHWQIKTASDLRREGWDDALIDTLPEHSGGRLMPETEAGLRVNGESGSREGGARRGTGRAGRGGGRRDAAEATREFKIYEGWFDFDIDGDGLAEKVKATWCGDGDECAVMGWEEWPLYRAPLFAACSVPLPHQAVGLCVADLVSDIQDLRSEVTRQYLDNLALANQGELVVNEGQIGGGVEYDSLLARGVGAVHRIRGDASITPLPVAVSTADALSGLEMSAGIVERRTGITSRTQSLAAERLQATATGASIMEEAVNQRLELIARVYAETFFKPLGRYLLHLLSSWPEPLVMRHKGRCVSVEPGGFDPDMDIAVSVGLGTANRSRMLAAYAQILEIQKQFIMTLGKDSPVRLADLVYTCHRMAEASGLEAPERFFGTEEQARQAEARLYAADAQPAFPSLAERRFQLEAEETRAKLALEEEKVHLKKVELARKVFP